MHTTGTAGGYDCPKSEGKGAVKASKLYPSAYIDTVGDSLRSKSNVLGSKLLLRILYKIEEYEHRPL